MSLRSRLLLSLAVLMALALVLAGVLVVGLTRASLIDRLDIELRSVASAAGPFQRLADLSASDQDAGRRLAVMRLDRDGRVVRAFPSGFATDPDPLPSMPIYTGGIPRSAFGQIAQRAAVDGSLDYRVLTARGGRSNTTLAIAAPMTVVDDALESLVRTLVAVGALAMAAMLVIAWFVIRQGLLPIERIAQTAEEITAGDLSHRAGVPHDATEVGRMGAAFDAMLDQIEASFHEQQQALDAVARSEERLRRFAADASHELRTPLTTIRGYADLYRAGGLSDPEAMRQAMDRIGSEGVRMSKLVDDLLLLARLDQGRPAGRDPVILSRLVDDAVADLRALEPTRPVTAEVEPDVVVPGDEDRLRQVVGNLLANVRVHSGGVSPVEVALSSDAAEGVAELRIVDHGQGIDPADARRVFDRFYRADPGRSRERGGTGLGLAIVASIVEAHGGRLWHEPTPGGGATFVVRLRNQFTAASQSMWGADSAGLA